MFDGARAKQLCFLILAGIAACRDVGSQDACRQKISPRLQNVLLDSGSTEKLYRVVIRLSDSTGVSQVAPSISIAGNSVATGILTAAEIRKLCILQQILFIDLSKQYHKLDQN
jgi:hypothetical protein